MLCVGGYVALRGQLLEQSLPPFSMRLPRMNQVTKPDSEWHHLLLHLTRPFIRHLWSQPLALASTRIHSVRYQLPFPPPLHPYTLAVASCDPFYPPPSCHVTQFRH